MDNIELIDVDYEKAREVANAVWGSCKRLHGRRIGMFDFIDEVTDSIEGYWTTILLNKGGNDGTESTNTGGDKSGEIDLCEEC